jgi:hypothetical protein
MRQSGALRGLAQPFSFALPQAGTFGTMGKGCLVGAGLFIWDMGIFKNFPIRAEFFNAFNLANFINPSASFSGAAFGGMTGATDSRIGQLALKRVF